MKNKIPNLPVLGARFLLCLSSALLALLLSLQFTLFNESYLLSTLESTNYFPTVAHTAKTVCEGLFSQAGFGAGLVTNYISEDTVTADITSALYNRFRNAGLKTNARFATLAVNLEDAMNAETGVIASEDEYARFMSLQASCEASYQTMVSPPFDTPLSIVLQYRSMRAVLFPAVAILILLSVFSLFKLSENMKQFFDNISRGLLPAGFACVLAGLSFVLFSGFQTWMPAENIAHTAFTKWIGGLFPYLAVLGILIGGAGLAVYAFLVRQIHLKQKSGAKGKGGKLMSTLVPPSRKADGAQPAVQQAQSAAAPSALPASPAPAAAPAQRQAVSPAQEHQAHQQPAQTTAPVQNQAGQNGVTVSLPQNSNQENAPGNRNIRLP